MKKRLSSYLNKAFMAFLTTFLLSKAMFAITVSFTSSNNLPCKGEQVQFTNTSSDTSEINFTWDFGDGNFSNDFNPSHAYINPGWYWVGLVADSGGSYLSSTSALIQVLGVQWSGPTSGSEFCPGQDINFFINTNDPQYDSIIWNFGDGPMTENGSSITHHYDSLGTYYFSAYIYSSTCPLDSVTGIVKIKWSEAPIFNIIPSATNACPGDEIFFSTNYFSQQYTWQFQGGGVANTANPSYAFSNYGQNMIVAGLTDQCGIWGYDTIFVQIDSAISPNMSNVYNSPNWVCPNELVQFQGYTPGNYIWNLGDGTIVTNNSFTYQYADTGVFNISVHVTNGCGLSDSMYLTQFIQLDTTYSPYTYFAFENYWTDTIRICVGTEVKMINYSSGSPNQYTHLWSFGDGMFSNIYQPSHIFNTPGLFAVTYTATNNCGGKGMHTKYVWVDSTLMPQDQLSILPNSICPGENVYFFVENDGSNSQPNYYNIWFGDGDSATYLPASDTSLNPPITAIHNYSDTGIYIYTFTSTNSCGNTLSVSDTIHVGTGTNPSPFYYTEHSADQTPACPGDVIDFFAAGGVSYVWYWNDGTPADSGQTASHTYSYPGTYSPEVYIINGCGFDTSIALTVIIDSTFLPAPWFYTNTWAACQGQGVTFYPQAINSNYQYYWEFPDSSLNTSTTTPTVSFSTGGNMQVLLNVTNGCGTSNSTGYITISDPQIDVQSASVNPTLCGQNTGSITNIQINDPSFGSGYSYAWTNASGDTVGSQLNLFNQPIGIYTLWITNSLGCSDQATFTLPSLNDPGIPSITGNTMGCIGDSTGILTVLADSGAVVTWYQDAALQNLVHSGLTWNLSFNGNASYYIQQTVGGCAGFPLMVNLTTYPTFQITQNRDICNGDSIMLGGAYQTSAGTYTDIYASVHGCDSMVITQLGLISVSSAGTDMAYNYCDSAMSFDLFTLLDSSASSNGLWIDNLGVLNGSTFDPMSVSPGTYTFLYSIQSSCGDDSAVYTISVNDCDSITVGRDELTLNAILNIYPNPNAGIFYVELPEFMINNTTIEITDVQGRQVYQTSSVLTNLQEIQLNQLSNGMYLMHIRGAHVTKAYPIYLQK